MGKSIPKHHIINTPAELEAFAEQHQAVEWLAFDTEFMGERRYRTLLCLIQVASVHGYYIIDPIRLTDLSPFIGLLNDERIVKITHAGENDYRILSQQYGATPKNLFDTQIGAGFAGYRYPISFRQLVESQLNVRLDKGMAVTDWEKRPIPDNQLLYALYDVVPLYRLYEKLQKKLLKKGHLEWMLAECAKYEAPGYFAVDYDQEIINHKLMRNLKRPSQLFLVRLLRWRRQKAEEKNSSLERILPVKLIAPIVKGISGGTKGLLQNRRIPDHIARKHGDTFKRFFNEVITQEELDLLALVPKSDKPDGKDEDILVELLHLLIKHKAMEEGVAAGLMHSRNFLRELREKPELYDECVRGNWREAFLGPNFCTWLQHMRQLNLRVGEGEIQITLADQSS